MPSPPTSKAGKPLLERILAFGGSDSGKTRGLLSIAKWHQRRKSNAVFYVVSNDMGTHPLLMPGGEFDDLENVVVEDVATMQEHFDAVRRFNKKIRSQDWLAVDLLSAVWEAAQDEYAVAEHGVDLAEYWGTQKGDDYPLKGWEWGKPNARYRRFAMNEVMRCNGHVMCMSGQRPLKEAAKSSGKGGEDPQIQMIYKRIGYAPAGQKDDTHRFHTVLHLSPNAKRDAWTMVPARERSPARKETVLEAVPLKDLFIDYLKGIGGWTL